MSLLLLAHSLVEIDELERLVLNVGKEVVVADEGKDMGFLQLEEVGEGFARLARENVAGAWMVSESLCCMTVRVTYSSAMLCSSVRDLAERSSCPLMARMTAPTS